MRRRPPRDPVRVLVIDDSATARRIIRTHLERDPRFDVVGEARDGREALAKVAERRPDVVTLDLHMPELDGVAFLRSRGPRGVPVVMVSSEVEVGSRTRVELARLGVNGMVPKCATATPDELKRMLAELTRTLLRVAAEAGSPAPSLAPARPANGLLAIGASTGGVEALEQVLSRLPADCPPVVVSQHMPPAFTSSMAQRFDDLCAVRVEEAVDGALLRPGLVLIAPGDRHLRVARAGPLRVLLGDDGKVNGHRPSVCVMFQSIAKLALPGVRAALLTGMGRDGASGLLALRQADAFTIAQDEATCVVYGMPRAAVELGAAAAVLPLHRIGEALMNPTAARGHALVRA